MNYRDEDIDNTISDPSVLAIFQADHTKMAGGKGGNKDLNLIKTEFSGVGDAHKRKVQKLLQMKKPKVELKWGKAIFRSRKIKEIKYFK